MAILSGQEPHVRYSLYCTETIYNNVVHVSWTKECHADVYKKIPKTSDGVVRHKNSIAKKLKTKTLANLLIFLMNVKMQVKEMVKCSWKNII